MPLPAVYGAVYATASSATPAGKIDSGKKAVRHLENLPLLVASDSLQALSNDGKWLPSFMRRTVARSIANRVAGLILVSTSAVLTSCITTLVHDGNFKLPPVEMLFWRSFVSWLVTLAAIASTGDKIRVKKEHRRALVLRCVTGCIAMTITVFVLQKLALSNATAITYFNPLLVFVMSYFFLKEKPSVSTAFCAAISITGAVLVVRPAFLFGAKDSTDAKWYRRSMASLVTSYLFGESLAIFCAVVVVITQAGAYVSLRSLQKMPHLAVMHYFLLTTTLVSLATLLITQHGKAKIFTVDMALETWVAILGTGGLAFAEQLFLTRGFQFDDAGILSAAQLFTRRDDVAAANSSWSVQRVTSELAKQWKMLTPAERKPWVELAQFDKARFRNEAHQYVEQQQADEQPVRLRVPFKRKKKDNEPRQPDTAYICFWKSRRPEVVAANPTLAAPLVSKEVGRQWKALSDEDRQVWIDMAAKDKRRFQDEIARLHPTLAASPHIPPSLKAPLKDPFAPKPAKTGFQLFMKHNRESFTLLNMTLNEFRAEMSKLWRRLCDADKSAWYDMAKQDQLRYETEMNAYTPPAYMSSALQSTDKRIDELKRLAREDESAPRLPMSAYNFYLSSELQHLQERLPGLKHNEIMREMGVAWKLLEEADRAPYQQEAEQDVDRFRTEMEAYLSQQAVHRETECTDKRQGRKRQPQHDRVDDSFLEGKKEATATRKKRKAGHPRRPKTAYNLMYMSKRTELLATYQMSHNECSALCGRLWREMSESEREPFKRMAEEDKRRYQAELELFKTQEGEANAKALRESLGFRAFLKTKRHENPGMPENEVVALWQSNSEPHRVLWSELGQEDGNQTTSSISQVEGEQKQLEVDAQLVLTAREMNSDNGNVLPADNAVDFAGLL
ncbi:hypothetical protein PHYBOEH_001914 [Phytophthora boehmeriae]|uniref:HMG box domain-containing protein n=1 Tax=Phytophthora boehmeriae TaxID=109152 RepID=A0A8T1WT54_9STRA|nr:hypothetical protein PHYBOEH_001914 [Phytophthora boehmeriae]